MTPMLIFFIACHGGPAAHFSEFAKEFQWQGHRVEILATGPALEKLAHLGARDFNNSRLDLDDPSSQINLAETIASLAGQADAVITDVGHPLMAAVHSAIGKRAPQIKRMAYYDNPEPFVPGGYSQTAAKVMAAAEKVLFANQKLVRETLYAAPRSPAPVPFEKRAGIGYYPLEAAKMLAAVRLSRKEIVRRQFLEKQKLSDTGQKILVYFGGNNEAYFDQALPAFLQMLREARLDPSQYLVLFQQHPGAKEKNRDLKAVAGHPLIVSDLSSQEAQVFADAALYYQTSMGPHWALAGIPSIQVGHEPFPDILVRNRLAESAVNVAQFKGALQVLRKPPSPEKLLADLGISEYWRQQLGAALNADRSVVSENCVKQH